MQEFLEAVMPFLGPLQESLSGRQGALSQVVRGHGAGLPQYGIVFCDSRADFRPLSTPFYGREDPQFFIDPQDLDSILRVPLEFNPALCQVLRSLCVERHDSPFYQDLKETQAHHFRGFINLKHQARLEIQHRLELRELWKSFERRNAFLS